MSLFSFAEVWPYLVFANGNQVFEFLRASFVFQYLNAIEIMLYMIIGIHYNPSCIPFPGLVDETFLLLCRNQIVQRSHRPVTISTKLSIGMQGIIQHLV